MRRFTSLLSRCLPLAFGAFLASALFAAEPPATKAPALTPVQLEKLITERKDVVVLDVRDPRDHREGHLRESLNLDSRAAGFKGELAKLDKSKTYVVHCIRGLKRTDEAVAALGELGFAHVLTLEGGYNAWVKEGKPVEKAADAKP
jgi:phage shock protein E